ncbi:MarR family transcriptional regulator [Agrobacterium tumefaciens]|nr:MarR family transcriptional regulator [Agrobacterium tumefaciens]
MQGSKFLKVTDTLRQYRRAELKDFEDDLGKNPVEKLYCDPLPDNAILNSVISNNTTFLLGRKGTGKSTVFAKAQAILRAKKNVIPIYVDVKSLSDLVSGKDLSLTFKDDELDPSTVHSHLLRKKFLSQIVSEIISSLSQISDEMSIWDKWAGKHRDLDDLKQSLKRFQSNLKHQKCEEIEVPVLKIISKTSKTRRSSEGELEGKAKVSAEASALNAKVSGEISSRDFEKTLEDVELYKEYSDIIFSTFPFTEILSDIKDLLRESGLKKLVIFFDDFSELSLVDQRLFVDVILAPLNNSSQEMVKLKVAGYPGRVYYGKIDPTKIETISLDFSSLYEAAEVQTMESSAEDYTARLIECRFKAFKIKPEDYFDTNSADLSDYYRIIFQSTFNVPRLMGALLHICYMDQTSKGKLITISAIKLAARKHYEGTLLQYFDRMNRFALEPFENKVDRQNQQALLEALRTKAREVRKGISLGDIGGNYFAGLVTPPVSHFTVSSSLNDIFSSLEANFFLSRYKDMRDKTGRPVTVYALALGLTELDRLSWGYPEGRRFRSYFVQRCFDYNILVHQFLVKNQTIRCDSCGASHPMDRKDHFEFFKWACPECKEGKCSVVSLAGDLQDLVKQATSGIQLDPVELEILEALNMEDKDLAAGEISTIIDTTYQLVGRRTAKMRDQGLVQKDRDEDDKRVKSSITDRAKEIYFAQQTE